MSLKKIILSVFTLAVVAIMVLVFVGFGHLDAMIRQTIITVGTQTTKTQVRLDQASISLRSGRGELHGLQIDNPKAYDSPYALLVDEVAVQIDPSSLLQDVIVINEIKLNGARLIAQHKGFNEVNLYTLAQNVKQSVPPAEPVSANPKVKTDVRLMIEKVTLENNHLRLISEQLGEQTLTLPPIELSNIGDKQSGLAPHELTKALLKPLLQQVGDAVKKALKEQAKTRGKDKLKKLLNEKLSDTDKEKLDKLKSLFKK